MKDDNGWNDNEPRTVAELLTPILDRVSSGEAVEHIPLRLEGLNRLTGGLLPGKLIVIAGHSGHGSTTLALDIALNAAVIHNVSTHITTLIDTPSEIMQRLLAAQAGVPMARIATGTVEGDDQLRISGATADLKAAPLRIDDNPSVTDSLGFMQDTRLVVIDGAHLLQEGFFAGSPADRAAEQSRALRRGISGKNITVVVTVPLDGTGGRYVPMMAHFKDLHPFTLDADMVLLTYRPDAVEREDSRAGEIDITVAKHRNGPTGVVTACAQTHYSRIVDFPK